MATKARSTKPTKKSAKKVAKKTARKVAQKGAKKATKKATKKVAKKGAKKVVKKAAKKAAKKAPARPRKARQKVAGMSAETRHHVIEKAAYYRAEKRGFQNGDPVADWLSSEKEVDDLLKNH